jgi:succinate dehydrogenase/fumarate reductase cytochrome b subunit
VLPFQAVSRQTVVELLLRLLPVHQIEVFAIVFKMAAHTILAIWVLHLDFGVISVLRGEPLCNFLVTIEAFEGWSAAAKLMAARTLRSSG